jgi:hypothetical protein
MVQRSSDRPTGGAGLPRANLTGFAQFATSPVSMRDSIPKHDDPISVVDSIRLMPFLIVPVAETGDEIEHHQNPSAENPCRLRAGRIEFRASCAQCASAILRERLPGSGFASPAPSQTAVDDREQKSGIASFDAVR